ncbi:non-SMC mitotic condensation complex subunit 1-domain-containing protein [Cyathus striatus]|nr:non-SMC mitotic condensation complex subunit 1-domain-containing protein [Cyathus striatus]
MATFHLQEHIDALSDIPNYDIPDEHDFSSESPDRLLEAAIEAIADSSDAIQDNEVFDVYRSVLKHAPSLPSDKLSKLLDSVTSGLLAELEATIRDIESGDQNAYMAHKTPLEMFAFLLYWFSSVAEKHRPREDEDAPAPAKGRRGRGGKAKAPARVPRRENLDWEGSIPGVLALIAKVLRLQTQRIWITTGERDQFINCITRPAYQIAESEAYMKNQAIRQGIYKIICLSVKHHAQTLAVQITIMQFLQFWEHLSEPMAECIYLLATEFNHTQLGDEILREIAGKTFSAQDNKSPRVFARFLTRFGELAPRLVLKQLSLLLDQLDSESYPMRIALIELIGSIITELANTIDTESNPDQTKKQIAGLYDLLLERILDVSSYVRVKVFTVLAKLCELKYKFPKQRLEVTKAAVGALEDKVASVRKSAVIVLERLILTHPYFVVDGGMLGKDVFQREYDGVKEELQKIEGGIGNVMEEEKEEAESEAGKGDEEMDVDGEGGDTEPEDNQEGDEDEDEDEMSVDDTDSIMDTPKKKKPKKPSSQKLKPRKSQLNVAALTEEQAALTNLQTQEISLLRLRKKFLSEALNFIRLLEGAMEIVVQLLGSTHKAEVLEAMEFFRIAHEYGFEGAKEGIKRMLHLIWTKDNSNSTSEDGKELKGVRQRLLECYKGLYFDALPDNRDAKAQINRIAKNMIERTYYASMAELTSLEEMMRIMMDEGYVHEDVIAKLWQIYSLNRLLPGEQRRGAIIILGMLAVAKRSVLTDHVDTMLKVGLGRLGKTDLTLARYTCVALQRLNGSAKKVKGSLLDKTHRYPMDSPIFKKLKTAIQYPCRSREWFGLAEQVINTVFALGEHPDVFCNELVRLLTVRAFSRKPAAEREKEKADKGKEGEEDGEGGEEKEDGMDEDRAHEPTPTPEPTQEPRGDKDLGDAFELSQLLFVVGHVAIKHIVYLELVEREWKRQKDEKQTADKQAAKDNSRDNASKDGEELDQVAGNAEDEIGERIAAIRETELLYGPESLLAVYGPMLVHICGSPHKFKNRILRAAATLSFSKFLCVSSQFCDQNHRLLFKILETSKDVSIRSNIVIALGDVAVSFSSIIDENSNELYKGLSDNDPVVKKNTLMVLTHLILNGMIKVKGQLGEMAKCLENKDTRISDLAKLFFSELSTKDNAIYNNLPDVISHLSTGEHAVDEETFQSTLKYIFTFIEKEKQAENIVEKLCQRFRLSEDPRQWRDIAFCLSLLPFKSERSVKKLIEGLQFYRDKLHEPKVFERFTEILAKARMNKSKDKPDAELDEFEKILEEHRQQGEEDQAFERRVEGKKAAAKKRATRKTARKRVQADDDSD